ncbi:hypothetical protein FOZ62_023369 [Perkinsus olseni]|uniref:Uncharacterized protein n=1 Tax=Perkinsus olseni TaxID=32597 RepID=A0A7J6RLY5_PEROL|nr:hypothetical protein FOZ62_023369 [Perkinsus olseni]
MTVFLLCVLSLVSTLSSSGVMALKATSLVRQEGGHVAPRKVPTRKTSLSTSEGNETICTIRYVGVSEKPYTLHIMHLPASEEYDEEEFFGIRATFTANNGRKAMLSYASNGSEYQMVMSSGKKGRVVGETGEKEKVHSKVGDVNPFYHLLGALRDDFESTECEQMADYIEEHPVDDYKPGMAWVVEYLKKISWPAFFIGNYFIHVRVDGDVYQAQRQRFVEYPKTFWRDPTCSSLVRVLASRLEAACPADPTHATLVVVERDWLEAAGGGIVRVATSNNIGKIYSCNHVLRPQSHQTPDWANLIPHELLFIYAIELAVID